MENNDVFQDVGKIEIPTYTTECATRSKLANNTQI